MLVWYREPGIQPQAENQKYGVYVNNHLMENAEYFARMWEKAEKSGKNVK